MKLRHLKFIVEHYGEDKQEEKAIEECAELIKELCKFKETMDNRENIIDEIADVEVMLNQLKIIYNCFGEVEERIDFKIDRQIERIKNEV